MNLKQQVNRYDEMVNRVANAVGCTVSEARDMEYIPTFDQYRRAMGWMMGKEARQLEELTAHMKHLKTGKLRHRLRREAIGELASVLRLIAQDKKELEEVLLEEMGELTDGDFEEGIWA